MWFLCTIQDIPSWCRTWSIVGSVFLSSLDWGRSVPHKSRTCDRNSSGAFVPGCKDVDIGSCAKCPAEQMVVGFRTNFLLLQTLQTDILVKWLWCSVDGKYLYECGCSLNSSMLSHSLFWTIYLKFICLVMAQLCKCFQHYSASAQIQTFHSILGSGLCTPSGRPRETTHTGPYHSSEHWS